MVQRPHTAPRWCTSTAPAGAVLCALVLTADHRHMPRATNREARELRNRMISADRARGLTLRAIALRHRLALSTVHRLTAHVRIALPNRWHRARLPQEAPPPAPWLVHRYRARQ